MIGHLGSYRPKQRYVTPLMEPEEAFEPIRVTGQTEEVVINNGPVPVGQAMGAQWRKVSPCLVHVDFLQTVHKCYVAVNWSLEPALHDS